MDKQVLRQLAASTAAAVLVTVGTNAGLASLLAQDAGGSMPPPPSDMGSFGGGMQPMMGAPTMGMPPMNDGGMQHGGMPGMQDQGQQMFPQQMWQMKSQPGQNGMQFPGMMNQFGGDSMHGAPGMPQGDMQRMQEEMKKKLDVQHQGTVTDPAVLQRMQEMKMKMQMPSAMPGDMNTNVDQSSMGFGGMSQDGMNAKLEMLQQMDDRLLEQIDKVEEKMDALNKKIASTSDSVKVKRYTRQLKSLQKLDDRLSKKEEEIAAEIDTLTSQEDTGSSDTETDTPAQ